LSNTGCLAKENNDEDKDTWSPLRAWPLCRSAVLFFLLRTKAISGKERLADQHKGLTQKIFGINQRFSKADSPNLVLQFW